jgi:large subunit ribosomal protein L33
MTRWAALLPPLHDMTESKHSVVVEGVLMARSTTRPVVTLRSTAGTKVTYVTRKNRLTHPDRLVVRKYDPVAGKHVLFREER